MQEDDFNAPVEQLNAGEQIPAVEPSAIEAMWEAISRIPIEQRQHVAVGLGAFARCDTDLRAQSPEQRVALMARYALLDALIDRGILNDYMHDDSARKNVFAAAASFPCNKDDLGEALAPKLLRDSPPAVAEKLDQEMRQAGFDPAQPTVADKFIQWMRDNCR